MSLFSSQVIKPNHRFWYFITLLSLTYLKTQTLETNFIETREEKSDQNLKTKRVDVEL